MSRPVPGVVLGVVLLALVAGACASEAPDPDYAEGRTVYRTCANCHGKQGEGGVGPDLTGVLETFPDCSDHVRWITLGSQGWRDEVGATYGAKVQPVEGGMPDFGEELSTERIAQAALYERVRFGGADVTVEKEACGLAD